MATDQAMTWAKPLALVLNSCSDPLPGSANLSDLLELGISLVFHHHASYHRRVVSDTKRLPMVLFWFGFAPPETACRQRQELAQQIMAVDDYSSLETTCYKLVRVRKDDLERCAHDGTVGPLLWSIVRGWGGCARSDVAINEGHNSLIKAISNRCRNIGLPLLSARANVKKELRVGIRGAPQKWSQVKQNALSVVQVRFWKSKSFRQYFFRFFNTYWA